MASLNSVTGSVCLYQKFKSPYLYHFWSDLDSRNIVLNHTRRVIFVYELKITFMSAKYIEQRRQTLKSIIIYNQSSATPFLETSKDHIYITYGRVWTVEVLLEIIWNVLFWFLSSKLRSEQTNTLNIGAKRSNQWSLIISHPPLLFLKIQRTISISLLVGYGCYKYCWKSYKTFYFGFWAQNIVQSSQIHLT